MNRYYVVYESRTGHCCFEASVIDRLYEDSFAVVCECFDAERAEEIAFRR
jgi:hypothetical protein